MTKLQLFKKYSEMNLTYDFQQMLLKDLEELEDFRQDYSEALEWVVVLFSPLADLVQARRLKTRLKKIEWYKAESVIDVIKASGYFNDPYAYAMWKTFMALSENTITEADKLKESPLLKIMPIIKNMLAADKAKAEITKNRSWK